jgi:uncharacterized surface protein with fasciclin (FAS1) repeats
MRRHLLFSLSLVAFLGLAACSDDVTTPAPDVFAPAVDNEDILRLEDPGAPAPDRDHTIVEELDEYGFSLLLAAVDYIAEMNPESAVVAKLMDRSQATVFAPNDEAFTDLVSALDGVLDPDIVDQYGPFAAIDAALGEGTVEAVVSYHVAPGRRAAVSVLPPVRDREIHTLLDGATFTVESDGEIEAIGNKAMILEADESASNGIFHEIDAVLLPLVLEL